MMPRSPRMKVKYQALLATTYSYGVENKIRNVNDLVKKNQIKMQKYTLKKIFYYIWLYKFKSEMLDANIVYRNTWLGN